MITVQQVARTLLAHIGVIPITAPASTMSPSDCATVAAAIDKATEEITGP